MIIAPNSTPTFFEAKYRQDSDPWQFASSDYEKERFETIIGALNHRRYCRAIEPGCSIGVLTERLAEICDLVNSSDFSASAVDLAKKRCGHLNNVSIACASFPGSVNLRNADLIVLSEIGYYFDYPSWIQIVAELSPVMASGATLLAVHWTGSSPDHQISGDVVHEVLGASEDFLLEYSDRRGSFRLDRWNRV